MSTSWCRPAGRPALSPLLHLFPWTYHSQHASHAGAAYAPAASRSSQSRAREGGAGRERSLGPRGLARALSVWLPARGRRAARDRARRPRGGRAPSRGRAASTAIVVGAAERVAAGVANSALCIDSAGELAGVYRKTHLFGAEQEAYVPGDSLSTITLGTRTLGVMICFDMEFPEVARTLAAQHADLLVTISANPLRNSRTITTCSRAPVRWRTACPTSTSTGWARRMGSHSVVARWRSIPTPACSPRRGRARSVCSARTSASRGGAMRERGIATCCATSSTYSGSLVTDLAGPRNRRSPSYGADALGNPDSNGVIRSLRCTGIPCQLSCSSASTRRSSTHGKSLPTAPTSAITSSSRPPLDSRPPSGSIRTSSR